MCDPEPQHIVKRQKTAGTRTTRTIAAFGEEVVVDEGDYLALLDFARMYQERSDEEETIDEAVLKVAGGPWCTSVGVISFLDSNRRITMVEIDNWHAGPLSLDCLFELDALEVLSFERLNVDRLPDCFDRLVNLKDLCFWAMPRLRRLPPSICSLQKLEKMRCKSCRRLQSLPENIGNLVNLQSLDTFDTPLRSLPESLGSLPRLTHLWVDFSRINAIPRSLASLQLSHLGTGSDHVKCRFYSGSLGGVQSLSTTHESLFKFEDPRAIESLSILCTTHRGASVEDRTVDLSDELKLWSGLKTMELRSWTDYTAQISTPLSESCPQLEVLEFCGFPNGNPEEHTPVVRLNIEDLGRVDHATKICLSNCILSSARNASLHAKRSIDCRNLRSLNLLSCDMTEVSALARINAPNLSRLELYDLSQLNIETFEVLATEWIARLPSLKALSLEDCVVGEISWDAVKMLADKQIKELDLSHNPIVYGDSFEVEKRLLPIVKECQSLELLRYFHRFLPRNKYGLKTTESEAIRFALFMNRAGARVLGGQQVCKRLWPSIFESGGKAFGSSDPDRDIMTEEDAIFILLRKRAVSALF